MTVQVVSAPTVSDLYFWALQASFADQSGTVGGAHLGLQWHSAYPSGTAVNWGGYDRQGNVLDGSESALPSALGNANTRDYLWRPGQPYRLRIHSADPGRWTGEIMDLDGGSTTAVRWLASPGDHLVLPMVWSEVFARCDADPTAVVWTEPEGLTLDGHRWEPSAYSTTYQREEEGGCSNTDSRSLPHGVGQFTGVTRTNPGNAQLPV